MLNGLLRVCGSRRESNTFASMLNNHTSKSLNCLLMVCGKRQESNTVASRLLRSAYVSKLLETTLPYAALANVFYVGHVMQT